jgi:hypothetical protein
MRRLALAELPPGEPRAWRAYLAERREMVEALEAAVRRQPDIGEPRGPSVEL